MVFCVPPAPFDEFGYSRHLQKVVSEDGTGSYFYKTSFSPEENKLINKFDNNITKLGLLDCSFLYSFFDTENPQIIHAKRFLPLLTIAKNEKIKTLECFPFATRKELDIASNCKWNKNNVIIEAENSKLFKRDNYIKGVNFATLFPKEGGIFALKYSSIRKKGLFNFLSFDSKIDFLSDASNLTNIEKVMYGPNNLYKREAKNCCNLFQFTKMLFHNQVLFKENVFKNLLEKSCSGNKKIGNDYCFTFLEKIENVYKQFVLDSLEINKANFDFSKNNNCEIVVEPKIDFDKCHFKFHRVIKKRFSSSRTNFLYYLVKEENGYHIIWKKDKSVGKKEIKEIKEFIKFYLSFCSIAQNVAREFLSEMLPENI